MRAFIATVIAVLSLWAANPALAGQVTLVASGSSWKYLDNGSDAGTAWRSPGFNDSGWPSGAAQLGYGDGDETTVVSYGPNASAKYITTYFRSTFDVVNPASLTSLSLELLRDDGAVVYLNGTEVFRSNMPSGGVGYQTLATTAIGGADESTFYSIALAPSLLASGANVLAVEVHQANLTSTDVSFDLRLTATDSTTAATVIRGPYLQKATPQGIVVRWRTDVATDSRVRYGASPGGLTSFADASGSSTEHEVAISGLNPETTYYYSVGTSTQTLAGDDPSHFFRTAPPVGASRPARIWILGDSGTKDANAAAVRNAYQTFTGATHTNLWLMLGDNAYENGTDAEYEAAVFDMYPAMLRKSALWPTIGNHDTAQSSSPPPTLPYFSMFTLPVDGSAGGLASGTEKYYSFDYANIHFICLDSMSSDRSVSGPMLTWLSNDLASTSQTWIVAFFHHPPYSKGSHDSDSDPLLTQIRQNVLPALENGGVDLVLAGHSHSYERSYLLDGHYGVSSTLTPAMKRDAGSGRIDGTGAYEKPLTPIARQGAVYAVAGSSGKISGGTLNHPAMFISLNNLGSLILDVSGNQLDAKFLRENGAVADYFTLIKATAPAAPSAPSNLTASAASSSVINLNWADNASNEDGFRVERGTDVVNFTQIAQLGPNVVAYQATGLSASTRYYFRVLAYNSGGSSTSSIADATTLPPPASPPSAPTNLTATAVSTTRVNLAWADNSPNESGFRIQRCKGKNCSNFALIATTAAGVTSYSDTTVVKNSSYTYRVRAYNAAVESAFAQRTVTTPRR